LEKVTKLDLRLEKLTDVKGLEKLTQLTGLNLSDNPDLTKAQIAALQKALPNCRIQHSAKK
jgi:Leucine-rich repeat (LRR) protein|tara:strand:+ start:578 stop:760 length:183 start_codon:yes stop_codon:yes gene_type:complete